MHISQKKQNGLKFGFTIIEIIIVITIIGILSTIVALSYSGLTKNATTASIKSDLINSSEQLKTYKILNNTYPVSITDCPTPAAGNLCLSHSNNNVYSGYIYDYTNINPNLRGFCVNVKNNMDSYIITSKTTLTPIPGSCSSTF